MRERATLILASGETIECEVDRASLANDDIVLHRLRRPASIARAAATERAPNGVVWF